MALAMDDSPQDRAEIPGEYTDLRQEPAGKDGGREEVPVEIHPPHQPIHSVRDFLLQLVTITAGVLIALSLEGLLEWNHYRMLVREARETITREIADNRKELESSLANLATRQKDLDAALRMTSELLESKKSEVKQISLGFSFAELSTAIWQSAERTGAVAHMDYPEVPEYSRLYAAQQLFADHQTRMLERVAAALAITGAGDPHAATVRDLEVFRQQVLALRADLAILQQLGRQLAGLYGTRGE
jgi:hypothetical protein